MRLRLDSPASAQVAGAGHLRFVDGGHMTDRTGTPSILWPGIVPQALATKLANSYVARRRQASPVLGCTLGGAQNRVSIGSDLGDDRWGG